ncbi:MAG: ATP-binding cassette domain-containing protein [Verrucomicrobiota bacterium]
MRPGRQGPCRAGGLHHLRHLHGHHHRALVRHVAAHRRQAARRRPARLHLLHHVHWRLDRQLRRSLQQPAALPSARRSACGELLNEPAETLGPVARTTRFRGDVSFDRVGFAYPSRPGVEVLKDLTFSVAAGKVVALVGPSGAGKSTIASLLLRFYDPQRGRIVFDGRAATDYGLHELRGQMALVPQEVLLFGGSIAENISYGKPARPRRRSRPPRAAPTRTTSSRTSPRATPRSSASAA